MFSKFQFLVILISLTRLLSAEQFGLFTYEVVGETITITDYPDDAVGRVEIPAEIEGKPVTRIGEYAFALCRNINSVDIPEGVTSIGEGVFGFAGLTTVIIPKSVTSLGDASFAFTRLTSVTIHAGVVRIGRAAFNGCGNLTAIEVADDNPNYFSDNGILMNMARTTLLQYPAGRAGHYTVPAGVTSIASNGFADSNVLTSVTLPESVTKVGERAFFGCKELTEIDLPEGLTSIGEAAFSSCYELISVTMPRTITSIADEAFTLCLRLTKVTFLGDAPTFGSNVFRDTAPGFTIYYLGGSDGFTSPTFLGYPSVMTDEAATSLAGWLMEHNLSDWTDLRQDLNGDGVSLLMAYALDLDPSQNLQGDLPMPTVGDDSLSMSFFGTRPGITYHVEISTDLENWSDIGVSLSEPNSDGEVSASVALDTPRRYLRLVVGN